MTSSDTVTGCMCAFGVMWRRMRAGDSYPFVAASLIGPLYIGIGAFGLVCRQADPFMAVFVVWAPCR